MLVSVQSTEHLQVGKEMDCSMEHAREHTDIQIMNINLPTMQFCRVVL